MELWCLVFAVEEDTLEQAAEILLALPCGFQSTLYFALAWW